MDKSLNVIGESGELDYLVSERPSTWRDRPFREITSWTRGKDFSPPLTATASRRLYDLARLESEEQPSVAHPAWASSRAIPRLVVTARYEGLDAFGSSRLLADLDLAARRAGSLHRQLVRGDRRDTWPAPMRTSQGGLRLLDARVGSFEILMTFWGSLAMLASSSPVAVAGLVALGWDVGRGSLRIANRWVGAALASAQDDVPSLQGPDDGGEPWGIQHTKALAPVLEAAAANGTGAELFLDETERKIKLTVLPRDSPVEGK